MNQIELIEKKRDGGELSESELAFLIQGYVDGKIPDYQVSAFLMAVYFRGMTAAETATLTRLMRDSGVLLDHGHISGFKADKHSTGGVGDKVSLILAPLVASAGVFVPMISGRALGHTGGTLDKLEAIPGFRTNLSLEEIDRQMREVGAVLVGQTAELTPADKKIYALRDATATVNSIPLITASILSKKMAEGIDALVLDVKAGSGAIFKEKEKAWDLARMLVSTASHFSLKTSAIVTAMEQPLGNAVGNWLETREAIETLRGRGPADLRELTLVLSAQMLLLAGKATTLEAGCEMLEEKLQNGAAFAKFIELVKWHGGDTSVVENPDSYPTPKHSLVLKSDVDGYVANIVSREVGIVSMALGAGRSSVEDEIDYTAGIMLKKKVGDAVRRGDPLATAYSRDADLLCVHEGRLQAAFEIRDERAPAPALIYGAIDAGGEKKWDAEGRRFV